MLGEDEGGQLPGYFPLTTSAVGQVKTMIEQLLVKMEEQAVHPFFSLERRGHVVFEWLLWGVSVFASFCFLDCMCLVGRFRGPMGDLWVFGACCDFSTGSAAFGGQC